MTQTKPSFINFISWKAFSTGFIGHHTFGCFFGFLSSGKVYLQQMLMKHQTHTRDKDEKHTMRLNNSISSGSSTEMIFRENFSKFYLESVSKNQIKVINNHWFTLIGVLIDLCEFSRHFILTYDAFPSFPHTCHHIFLSFSSLSQPSSLLSLQSISSFLLLSSLRNQVHLQSQLTIKSHWNPRQRSRLHILIVPSFAHDMCIFWARMVPKICHIAIRSTSFLLFLAIFAFFIFFNFLKATFSIWNHCITEIN